MSKTIILYNTASKTEENFTPMQENSVKIYSCGPTVYHYPHLGNLRAVIFADTLRRMFVYVGYTVQHVINITDVGHLVSDGDDGDDKMEKGAAREGKSVWDIAKFYTDDYFNSLKLLNIPIDAYSFPRATDTIPEQITLIQTLVDKGYTYTITDGIYFDTSKFPAYPEFAHLDIKGLQSGARVAENLEKKNITDFALWKFSSSSEKRQMEWESPWGIGFPGWHIECSAMSKKLLGTHFDIHTGGIDHIPVHHTNEIAQSVCANDEQYVNYWMHVNFLNDASGKMSKSNGEFLRLQTLLEMNINPLVYRYYLLMTHYRSEIAFSFESIEAAETAYNKLVSYLCEHKNASGVVIPEYKNAFEDVLYKDLGTPSAIALIWKLVKDNAHSDADKVTTIIDFDNALGLGLKDESQKEVGVIIIPEDVQKLLDDRKLAKENKNYTHSDELRTKIEQLGYTVTDTLGEQKVSKQ